jgi:myo-inositol-1(or 4)-monophosphatase
MKTHEPPGSLATDLLRLASDAANDAASLLLKRYNTEYSVRFKLRSEIVTDVDLEAERLIKHQILSARAGDGFLGEEDKPVRSQTGVTWLVDPIDGTTNYVRKLPGFVVSIAASWEGTTLAAAVCDPVHQVLYTAAHMIGAFADGKAIRVSSAENLGNALIGTGFSIEVNERMAQASLLTKVSRQVGDLRFSGVCAYDLCHVATGSLDGYYESHLKIWDYAAGLLIAREAGAIAAETQLKNGSDRSVVAAAPGIYARLQECISAVA